MMIDFVITWVDMNDPEWQKDYAKYKGGVDSNDKNSTSVARFRDHGLLKYWFRGVEEFAPWVRKIHFVTCGQKPEWLNANHPKLNLVNHKDYMPEQFLPCFNSNVIEIYMHKIEDLYEHFVYFNDDFFIINNVENRFFTGDLPNDIACFRHNTGLSQWEKMLKNNIKIINKKFDKKTILKRDYDKWFFSEYGKHGRLNRLLKCYNKFIALRTPHNAQPYLKKTFNEVWEYCGKELTEMSNNRFRTSKDLTLELFKTWQICQSNFMPYNTYKDTKMFPLLIKSKKAIDAIRNQKYSLICLNDNVNIRNYEKTMKEINYAFKSILSKKSSFEI